MKKKNKKKVYTEVKGLFIIATAILLSIALISFSKQDPHSNFLGVIGYGVAWIFLALFGMGSYLITFFLGWIGWKSLSFQEINNYKFKYICFALFLISTCILLNVFAEILPQKALILQNKIFSEQIYNLPSFHNRYNLGGIPLYYLYKDIPFINLKTLFSNTGIGLIFFTIAFISFLIFFEIKIIHQAKTLFINIKKLFTFAKPIKTLEKEVFTIKKNISYTPILKKPSPKIFPKPILKKSIKGYTLPCDSLLSSPPSVDTPFLKKEFQKQATILEDTLKNFGIKAKVGEINCGPTITSFELHPAIGVKVQRIKALENDIALNLQAKSIRIIAPIPGKAAVGVEVPSLHPQTVSFKEMLLYYQNKKKHNIPLLLGKTVCGDHVITDLGKMPHLLIAGATGAGKSVCINTIVMSILMNLHPEEIKLIMIDPKKVELTQYSRLPHMIAPVITEPHGAYAALQWLVREMQKRYDILKQLGLRNISSFNNRKPKKDLEESLSIEIPEKMPFIVMIIDEFADLMMVSSTDLETPIARIAQMARAVGIHMILATQRPSREVITGIIKANIPSRIAFKVASRINSQIILDETGAESLLGNGDLLFLPPGTSHLVRAQGAYISDEEINAVIDNLCKNNSTSYLIDSFDAMSHSSLNLEEPKDKLYSDALDIVLKTKNASTTFLQRKLKIGYARAASLIDELEENKIISPPDGSKARKVIATKEYFN